MDTRRKRKIRKTPTILISSDSESDINLIPGQDSDYEDSPAKKKIKVVTNNIINATAKSEKATSKKKYIPKKTVPSTILENCEDVFSTNNKGWRINELLAERECISPESSKNIVQLFENENTIPFICRYRRDLVENITPEKLRNIKNSYVDIIKLQKRSEAIINQLQKDKVLNKTIRDEFLCAKTFEELEFLYAPYKPASKGSLADRAKALGLEPLAEQILYGKSPEVDLQLLLKPSSNGLETIEKISSGIIHIISHIISKNTDVLEQLRKMQKFHRIILKSSLNKTNTKSTNLHTKSNNTADQSKYELYFNFENAVRYIKPHQILAINRGEKAKLLSVKIIVPDGLKNDMKYFIRKLFLSVGIQYYLRTEFFEKSFEECYTKKLQPLLSRQLRSDLLEKAKKAAIDVFAKNLKQLFMMSPLKGEKILGIDPGFANGCKLALISETTDVLETGIIYPHTKYNNFKEDGEKLAKMLLKHNCRIIALGNGTACRETEFWLTKLFDERILDSKYIKYTIVSEQGASIYSCSDIAKKEFPKLDVNLISATSIARRLNDPLSEYVKIEPKHIGVGMYQHDITEHDLTESLNEVVMECVSYVGVDINTASISILKHISGLTELRASKIIDYRLKNGPFKTRKDILKVKSIGEKTFLQCAGFIRIEPKCVGGSVDNLLDCTWVHPESYDIAKRILSTLKLKLADIGKSEFINTIKSSINFTQKFATDFKIPKERIDVILEALQRELFQDYRNEFDKKPLFKNGISKMSELKKGSAVSGAVTNITHFGAFVDIGVEHDGLIHTSNMNGMILNIGDRVDAFVIDVEVKRKRLQLRLENMTV